MNPYGPFGNMMPYSNFHGMNLDWVIQIAKDFLDQYSHIQETITDGEDAIDTKVTEGQEALAAKAEELEGLLDQWYNTHSEDIADALTQAVADFGTAAAAEAARVIETIPEDYTTLSNNVTRLLSDAVRSGRTIITNENLSSLVVSGDMNDLVEDPFVYYCNGLTAGVHQPVTTMTGMLMIFKYSNSPIGVCQLYVGNDGVMAYRNSHGSSDNPSWDDWSIIDVPYYMKSGYSQINESTYDDIMESGDFNNLYADNAIYYCHNLESAAHQPVGTMSGMFMVFKYRPASSVGLMQIYFGNDGQVFYRTSHGSSLYWDRWRQVGMNISDYTVRIFRKVVCCGDSYTAGYIVDTQDNVNRYNEAYAWPATMARITGNTYVNCGVSGANSAQWLTNQRGLAAAQLSGKAQAYIIGLGLNDSSDDVGRHLDLGTTADIGQDVDTYYGRYSQIIREMALISPSAHIFCTTIPGPTAAQEGYNTAVADIVTAYAETYDVYLVDLDAYRDMFRVASITGDKRSGHYTSIGYEQFGEILTRLISRVINSNLSKFIDVNLIPFESSPAQSAIQVILDNNTATPITFSNTYVSATGKYYQLSDGDVVFSIFIRMKANVTSGVNNILTGLPVPGNTNVMFYEHDIGDVIRPDRYLSYTTGWRLNNKHTSGDYCFFYGKYTPSV